MSTPLPFEYMEWVETELYNWHLKEGAPPEVVEAFEEWMDAIDMKIEVPE